MIICPRCSTPRGPDIEVPCLKCGWAGRVEDGILNYLDVDARRSEEAAAYLKNYDQIASDDLSSSIMNAKFIEDLAESFMKCLPPLAGKEVCDVGSGKGFLTERMIKAGAARVTSIDIIKQYLLGFSKYGDRCRRVLANVEFLPFEAEFDAIVSTDVIEHVLNLGSAMHCIRRALRPGGILAIRLPYRENLSGYSPHLGCKYPFVHLRSFTKQGLGDLFAQNGFRVINVSFDGYYVTGEARGYLQKVPLGQAIVSRLAAPYRRKGAVVANLAAVEATMLRLLFRPMTISMVGTKL